MTIETSLLLFVVLFGTGGILVVVAGVQNYRFFWSYTLSLLILIVSQNLTAEINPSASPQKATSIFLVVFLIAVFSSILIRNRSTTGFSLLGAVPKFFSPESWGIPVLISILFLGYHLWAGPYTEIPSDFWKHLARANAFLVENDPIFDNFIRADGSGQYWYRLIAVIAANLNIDAIEMVHSITGITGLLFLLSTYFFSLHLFATLPLSSLQRISIGVVASFLTFIYMGTATFSYVRYYALAPAIVVYPIVYFAILKTQAVLQGASKPVFSRILEFFSLPLLWSIAFLIHTQEAFFIALLTLLLTIVYFCRKIGSWPILKQKVPLTLMACLVAVTFFITIVFTRDLVFWLAPDFSWQKTPHLVDAGQYVHFLSGLPIASPAFRIWDTVGVFGVIAIFFSMYRWRYIIRIDYFVAALLIPAFTFFNPLFVSFFLNFSSSSVVWRTAYLMPFPIIFSYLIVTFFGQSHLRRALVSFTAIAIIFSTSYTHWPGTLGNSINRVSRIPSIWPTDLQSGAGAWIDMIQAFSDYHSRHNVKTIVSDPMTTFVLSASVLGRITSYVNGHYFPANNDAYISDFEESDHSRNLLILNERGGRLTKNATLARHWPPTSLDTKTRYPKALSIYLSQNKAAYREVWANSDIKFFSFPKFVLEK